MPVPFPIAASIIAAVLFAFYRYLLYPAFFSPLCKLPVAHATSSFCGLWTWIQRLRGREIRSIYAAHQRCGPIVRLGPSEVSVASLDGVRKTYGAGFERSRWFFEEFQNYDGTPNLVTMFGRESHSTRRRMMSHLYSKSYLIRSPDFQGCVRSVIFERLMPILEDAAGKHEGLDVYEIGSAVGAEIMSAYAFGTGKSFDIVRTAKEEERKQYLERGKKKLRKLKGAKEARRALEQQCLVKCKDAYEDFQQNLDIGADAKEHANGRNDGSSTYPVTFSQLVQQIPLKENIRDSNEVLRRIASEVLDNIEAAREGIGIGLTYMTHELSQHMDVQDSLRQELKTLEPHCIFTSSQDLPSLTEMLRNLDGLPLLDAVVTETLRLHPPALGATPRDVPEQGVLVEGYFIPSGTIIHSSPYCLHRQSEVFPDAESWKPERWMRPKNRTSIDNNTPENDSDGKVKATQKDVETHRGDADIKQWLFHFSKGPKMCVGNNFALIVMKTVLAAIYTTFETWIIDDEGIEQPDEILAPPTGDKLILGFKYSR